MGVVLKERMPVDGVDVAGSTRRRDVMAGESRVAVVVVNKVRREMRSDDCDGVDRVREDAMDVCELYRCVDRGIMEAAEKEVLRLAWVREAR